MPLQLISGPDLGAGFLHQLTHDEDSGRSRFLYHAQPGGQDAGGPPAGPLDLLGYLRAPEMCPIGGRLCWHRPFFLAVEETPSLRIAYNRTRFFLWARLRAALDETGEADPTALRELFRQVAPALDRAAVPWTAVGRSLPGGERLLAVRPVQLLTTPSGASVLAEALREHLIEPLAPTTWPPGLEVLGARAFIGSVERGVDVLWRAEDEGTHRTSPAPAVMQWEEFRIPLSSGQS